MAQICAITVVVVVVIADVIVVIVTYADSGVHQLIIFRRATVRFRVT